MSNDPSITKNMKKIFTISTILIVLIIISYFAFIFTQKERFNFEKYSFYYQDLAQTCMAQNDPGCCLSSVKIMADNNFLITKSTDCPVGQKLNALLCLGSLKWCEPKKDN